MRETPENIPQKDLLADAHHINNFIPFSTGVATLFQSAPNLVRTGELPLEGSKKRRDAGRWIYQLARVTPPVQSLESRFAGRTGKTNPERLRQYDQYVQRINAIQDELQELTNSWELDRTEPEFPQYIIPENDVPALREILKKFCKTQDEITNFFYADDASDEVSFVKRFVS